MNRTFRMLSRYLPMIFLLAAISVGCTKEPEYQGVGLKLWVKQLSADDPTLRTEAAQAIGAIGKIAREPSEPSLRQIAKYDPRPATRVAAILALKAIGAPTAEFESYLKEVTAPLTEDESDDEDKMGQGDADIMSEAEEYKDENRQPATGQDDIEYLQALEAMRDSVIDSSSQGVMPTGEEERKEWIEKRRSDAMSTLLQELQNPDVLAEMIKGGDPLQRRMAARMLQNQEGGENARVFEILTKAKADSDTVLKRLAEDALKKWTNP